MNETTDWTWKDEADFYLCVLRNLTSRYLENENSIPNETHIRMLLDDLQEYGRNVITRDLNEDYKDIIQSQLSLIRSSYDDTYSFQVNKTLNFPIVHRFEFEAGQMIFPKYLRPKPEHFENMRGLLTRILSGASIPARYTYYFSGTKLIGRKYHDPDHFQRSTEILITSFTLLQRCEKILDLLDLTIHRKRQSDYLNGLNFHYEEGLSDLPDNPFPNAII